MSLIRYPDAEILVMARAPIPGKAKTRLIPALGKEGAAHLHACLVERMLTELKQARLAPVTLYCSPNIDHPFFHHCRERYGINLKPQRGKDLGQRISSALSDSLKQHHSAILLGCDIPELGASDVQAALLALKEGAQAAITPTEDGGYALVALSSLNERLFEEISWGSDSVYHQTKQRLSEMGWSWRQLPQRWDVDRPEDLKRLAQVELPPAVQACSQLCISSE